MTQKNDALLECAYFFAAAKDANDSGPLHIFSVSISEVSSLFQRVARFLDMILQTKINFSLTHCK